MKKFYILLMVELVVFFTFQCKPVKTTDLENRIEYGNATLVIEFDSSVPDSIVALPFNITVKNRLLGELTILKTNCGELRLGNTEIPVWYTALGFCEFFSDDGWQFVNFYLSPGKSTTIHLSMSDSGKLTAAVDMPLENVTSEEIKTIADIIYEAISLDHPDDISEMDIARFRIIAAQNYLDSLGNLTPFQRKIAIDAANSWLFTELYGRLSPEISELNILKTFDLNRTRYLYNSHEYFTLLNFLLHNYSNELPPLMETKPENWIAAADKKIGYWIDHERGFFYDMLVMTNYARQLAIESTPFSAIQKENIEMYFKNDACTKVLLDMNRELIESEKPDKEHINVSTVHTTPGVPSKELMDAILSKYEGNVVIVDFWETWCLPCLRSINEMKPIKERFNGQNVKFIYIASESSPAYEFDRMVPGIGGEHYRLKKDERVSVMNSFRLDGVPSYLIYDASGNLMHKFTGYQGNDMMLKMITDLLK